MKTGKLTFQEIMSMNLKESVSALKGLILEGNKEAERLYENVSVGIKIKVPIQYFVNGWYKVFPNTKRAKISGHGKCNLIAFLEEKELRETMIKNFLTETLLDDNKIGVREE